MLLRCALSLAHRPVSSSRTLVRAMSGAKSYSSSELLINDAKYSWLRKLGLQEENPGVYDGTWHASGPVSNVETCAVSVPFGQLPRIRLLLPHPRIDRPVFPPLADRHFLLSQ